MLRYRAAASAHAGVGGKLKSICRLLAGRVWRVWRDEAKPTDRCDLVLDAYVLMY